MVIVLEVVIIVIFYGGLKNLKYLMGKIIEEEFIFMYSNVEKI